MRVLLFGATGMLGQGVLRECLLADDVELVRAVGRSSTGVESAKLDEVIHPDLFALDPIEPSLRDFDACFFCLGVSSAGMSEEDYSRLTFDLTISVARRLAQLNPEMTFIYVSGTGTDSSESGRVMWARVKGRTENELQRLPFREVCLFRPGIIQPLHGARSKTTSYRIFYTLTSPVLWILRRLFPRQILTTEIIGEAMLTVARHGAPKPVLESADIDRLVRS